ncbi:MAG: TetR/AcrR family transcriptional regulator [Streptosporangiales bacterium]|nr:TetR/AcrR family transcriptional regulator [Streptosporangiales bacterium]
MTTQPRRLTPGDRRRQILDTARQLLDVKHLGKITVEEAARLAGVSPGLVFHYFGSQIGFRRALAEEAARELLAQMKPDPALSHVDQLRGGLERFIEWVEEHPRLYVAVASNGNPDAREVHDTILNTVSSWIIGIAADMDVNVTSRIELAVSGWIAFTEKVAQNWLADPRLTRDELADLCEKTLYQGLQVVLDDPREWRRVKDALDVTPEP